MVRELTSSFDDVDKRLAIFLGLGAFLFSSLFCLVQGASFETYIIQGVVAALVFMLLGYAYAHWLRGLIKEHGPANGGNDDKIEFRSVDAQHLSEEVVNSGEYPETVIEETGTVVPHETGAAAGGESASHFEMPDFGESGDEDFGAPSPPAPPAPRTAGASAATATNANDDLPPPPVPSGA
jgi:hypothetical protein